MNKSSKYKDMKHIHLLLMPTTYKKLEEKSIKEDRKISPMIRRIIEQWLETDDLP